MNDLLLMSLEVAVPLNQMEFRRLPFATLQRIARESADVVASKGDVLQFGGKGCAEAFNALARGLAAASFCPGGVKFMGVHWQGEHAGNPE